MRTWNGMLASLLAVACAPGDAPASDTSSGDTSSEGASEDGDGVHIVDQSGAEFIWNGRTIELIDGVSPRLPHCELGQEPGFELLGQVRFAVVIGTCFDGHGSIWWGRDRIVVCDDDSDCPVWGDRVFECRAGFCQDADTVEYPVDELTYPNLFELCFGETPRDPEWKWDSWDEWPGSNPETVAWIWDSCNIGNIFAPCEFDALPASCATPW